MTHKLTLSRPATSADLAAFAEFEALCGRLQDAEDAFWKANPPPLLPKWHPSEGVTRITKNHLRET